ncbi:MAG: hypothetical protein GX922_04810 [Firmicutes bacterium]|nr:hypothetical protein [Bacillota bacterium]
MMSLSTINLFTNVKRQLNYKLKANAGILFSLVAVQLLAALLSYNGTVSIGWGSGTSFISLRLVSGDIIIIFSLIWAFTAGLIVAANSQRYDFVFVTNRLSSNLSSVAVLFILSVGGGVSATLCGILLRVYLLLNNNSISSTYLSPYILLIGICSAVLYSLLFSAIGYFLGILSQRNKAYAVLLPALFFGLLFVEARSVGSTRHILSVIYFFIKESSLLIFALKILLAVALLYSAVILIANRMEVRQ